MKSKTFYRCNGTKCEEDKGTPMCFYTSNKDYAIPGMEPKVIGDAPTEEDERKWSKECRELAEWQTFLPVEERMPCKRHLPVFPAAESEGNTNGDVQA